MIKETEIIINGHSSNYKHYISLGYDTIVRKPFLVKTKDLMPGSMAKITTVCDNCGGESKNVFKDYYVYTDGLIEPFYCKKCKSIKSKKTCLEKYGVDNPMKSDVVKDVLKNSLMEKYGVDHYSKTDEYKEKFIKTNIERYGVNNPFKSEEVRSKIRNTNKEKYGVEYPQQSDEIKAKSDETNLSKYGFKKYSQTEEFKIKNAETHIERYGMNYHSTDEAKSRIKSTNIEKYGVDHYSKTDEFKSSIKAKREDLTKLRYENLIGHDYDIIDYTDKNFTIYHKECKCVFEVIRDVLYARLNIKVCLCTKCFPIEIQYSYIELEMRNFISSLNIDYEVSNKKILNGKELDIYIPEHNLAIEMNGIYWHSEIYLDENYHINKTLNCRELGIDLLHVWEDDWKYKREIVKSIILNKLGLIENKIYARKCVIKNVNSVDVRKFLDENHIQGFSPSQIKLGLYHNDELVSLMTFGWRYTNGKKEFELIRFCNIINYSIIGAASKLFNYFVNNNNCEIISYADISVFTGGLYNQLGFNKVSLSKPNYFWVIDGIRKHRFNYNKQKLISEGFDIKKTEVTIMHERGYYRIWGCGQEKWVYKK